MDHAMFLLNPDVQFKLEPPISELVSQIRPAPLITVLSTEIVLKGISHETLTRKISAIDADFTRQVRILQTLVGMIRQFKTLKGKDAKASLAMDISLYMTRDRLLSDPNMCSRVHLWIADEVEEYMSTFNVTNPITPFSRAKTLRPESIEANNKAITDAQERTFRYAIRRYNNNPFDARDKLFLSHTFINGPLLRYLVSRMCVYMNPFLHKKESIPQIHTVSANGSDRMMSILHNTMFIFTQALTLARKMITDITRLGTENSVFILDYAINFNT